MTLERREREFELLKQKYGELEHGENLDWVQFKRFPMPPGWNREATELLVVIPPGYPATPPDNFFVRDGLRTAGGAAPGNYSEGQSVLGGTWAQFSYHAKEWNPAPDPNVGDSILTFMIGVEARLREGN